MALRNHLLTDPSFIFERNIFYQKGLGHSDSFEKKYIELRKSENRVYADEVVRNLPDFEGSYTLKKEWMIRKITLMELIRYLQKKDTQNLILELGCGNGWLSHQLARSIQADIFGLDINETELTQGARIFGDCQNLSFMYGDIFTIDIKKNAFDTVILAGSIQYFPDFTRLAHRLLDLLNPTGEIHIVDSPIYASSMDSKEAKKRSDHYFSSGGVPAMANHYFHHHANELKNFNHQILFKPNYLVSLFSSRILRRPQRSFPWILIKHH